MTTMNYIKTKTFNVKPVLAYQLSRTLYLTLVPVVCMMVLTLLLFIFAKLNLYYLEANGLIINPEVRDAYYKKVQWEIMSSSGYLLLEIAMTVVVSYVLMLWATAPFRYAEKFLKDSIKDPQSAATQRSKWLSESPAFDYHFKEYAAQLSNKDYKPDFSQSSVPLEKLNILFLIKFGLATIALSIITGYTLGIIFNSMYEEIVSLALQLVQNAKVISHYFVAQQEVLADATTMMVILSLVSYLCIGIGISRYMANMSFVFCRAIKENRLPMFLRYSDIYHDLKDALNEVYAILKKREG